MTERNAERVWRALVLVLLLLACALSYRAGLRARSVTEQARPERDRR